MQFTPEVKEQFKKAGWKNGRNIKDHYENANILRFDDFPEFLKSFLYEYGNLTVEDIKPYKSKVVNKLKLGVEYSGYENEEDYQSDIDLIGKMLFPFAFFDPDCYMIACDVDGKVYMLGDYTFRIADNFEKGIEILIKYDWSNGYYQLDEKTGEWLKSKNAN